MNATEKCALVLEHIAELLERFYSGCESFSCFDSASFLSDDYEIELNFYDRSI